VHWDEIQVDSLSLSDGVHVSEHICERFGIVTLTITTVSEHSAAIAVKHDDYLVTLVVLRVTLGGLEHGGGDSPQSVSGFLAAALELGQWGHQSP
jgi:hypothetical protein